jgi:hypothetical protein
LYRRVVASSCSHALADAVGAEEAEDLAASDGELDAADGLDLARGLEPGDLNCGWVKG